MESTATDLFGIWESWEIEEGDGGENKDPEKWSERGGLSGKEHSESGGKGGRDLDRPSSFPGHTESKRDQRGGIFQAPGETRTKPVENTRKAGQEDGRYRGEKNQQEGINSLPRKGRTTKRVSKTRWGPRKGLEGENVERGKMATANKFLSRDARRTEQRFFKSNRRLAKKGLAPAFEAKRWKGKKGQRKVDGTALKEGRKETTTTNYQLHEMYWEGDRV